MAGRRDKEDEVLTEYVKARLAHILEESVPRRVRPEETRKQADVFEVARGPSLHRATVSAVDAPSAGRRVLNAPGPPREVPRQRSVDALPGRRFADPDVPDFEPSDDEEAGLLDAVVTRSARRSLDLTDRDDLVAMREVGQPDMEELDWGRAPPRRLFTRTHLGVVSALLLIGLLGAGWSVLRARPVAIASTPLATPAVNSVSSVPSVVRSSASPAATASPALSIMVHVLGAVRKPGVVTLAERSRVRDAIAAAGGLTDNGAPGQLNLAQVLTDGEQIIIGTKLKPAGEVRNGSSTGTTSGDASDPGSSGASVNLNTATQPQLEELPGVGPVTAAKILTWRQEHGRFNKVEELQEIDGIGPKTYAQIAPHARV